MLLPNGIHTGFFKADCTIWFGRLQTVHTFFWYAILNKAKNRPQTETGFNILRYKPPMPYSVRKF